MTDNPITDWREWRAAYQRTLAQLDDARDLVSELQAEMPAAYRAGYRAALDAAAVLVETWMPQTKSWHGWKADEVPEYIAFEIRDLHIPEKD